MVKQITTAAEYDALFAEGKPIIIDFTATWCGPCKRVAPVFADFAEKVPEAVFIKIDVDDAKELAQQFKIEAMPTFVFVDKDKKEFERVRGADLDKIVAAIKKCTGKTVSVPEPPTKVKTVTTEAELAKVFEAKKPVVIDFTATWCGPCKQVAPVFADISNQVGHLAEFVKIDVDAAKELAQKFNITAMPTFVIMKDATTEAKRVQGADIRKLVSAIESTLNEASEAAEAASEATSAVKKVKTVAEFEALFAAKKPVIVDFTASWCGPCKRIAPKYAELASQVGDAVFCKIDVDQARELAERFGIQAMPTFVIMKDAATEADRIEGADIDAVTLAVTKVVSAAAAA
jgi:thioredoxin 1